MALYHSISFRERNLRGKDMEKRLNAEEYIKELEAEIVKLKQEIDELKDQLSGATPAYVDQD
jgi:peptidoglycan hydrolase CwlO-like protein